MLSTNQRILSRFSIPNERGLKKKCQICNIKFQLIIKKQHQCKRCLRCVCELCGPQRRTVYQADGSQAPHRCCTVCLKQIDMINQYKSRYKLCFGQDSQFVLQWVNRLNKDRVSYDNILNEFSDNVTSVTNDNTIRFKRESDILINDLMAGYNYSLRHFIRVVIQGVNTKLIETKVRNVMVAVFARIKTLPYVPELIYLAVFFLCFANEAHSYFIITRIIQKIYPQYVRVNKMRDDNLLTSTLKTILQMYRICVGKVDRNQLEAITKYLQTRFNIYVLTFTLNVCSMPCSFFILSQMLKTGSSLAFYKGIAAMMSYCREQIASYRSFYQVEVPLLRSVNDQNLKACFILFEKSDAKFEVTNQVFDSVQHRKLHQKYKQMQSLYAKSQKNLSEKQTKIKQIISQLNLKKKQLQIQAQKNKKLQLDLLKLSNNVPKLLKFQEMTQMYEATMARNASLEQKCAELQLHNQKIQKQKMNQDRYRRMWAKLQDDYNKQIVDLKTKNQIMEIQVSAKQIDFNTSYIQRRFQQKNVEINMLNQQIKHLKSQLQYYKLKVLQKSYNRHLKDNNKITTNNFDQQRERQFEKHIRNSNQLVENLKKQLEEIRLNYQESQKKVKQLTHKNEKLEQKIKEIEQLSKVIKQIPQQYNYIESIQQVQRIVEKQTNFMKRKALQSVKDSFLKCYRQLRFRNIDCRIKEDKIKNSVLVKLFNPDNINQFPRNQPQTPGADDLFSVLNNFDHNKLDPENSNKQCSIM